jgi:trans-L-3-hydroxyproline dehydratase
MEEEMVVHPFEQDLSFLYGTIFVGPPVDPSHHSRNVCVFADGEVDRSPTGTGLSARAAIHHTRNELDIGESLTVESILGTLFKVRISEAKMFGPYPAVIPEVTGSASIIGQHTFYFDPDDPLKKGFIFR